MHRTLGDMVIDLAQNSFEAGATLVVLDWVEHNDTLSVYVADNGKGMDEETLKKALDPFYTDGEKHSRRKVGLGLPFVKQTAESAGGSFEIDSRAGEGTSVSFSVQLSNVDCPPSGDLKSLFAEVMMLGGKAETVVNRFRNGEKYTLVKSELADALGGLEDTGAISLLKDFIQNQEENL